MNLFTKAKASPIPFEARSLDDQRLTIRRLIEIHPEFRPQIGPRESRPFVAPAARPGLLGEIIPFPRR